MRGQPASSRDRHRGRTGPSRGGAAGSGGDALRVVRATRDQLGVAWSAEADPFSWRVVCWDSSDAAVARLELSGTHRRATFAGSCSFAAAVHHRRLRPGTRWLRALAGWACRSVSAGRSAGWASGILRPDASATWTRAGLEGVLQVLRLRQRRERLERVVLDLTDPLAGDAEGA